MGLRAKLAGRAHAISARRHNARSAPVLTGAPPASGPQRRVDAVEGLAHDHADIAGHLRVGFRVRQQTLGVLRR